MKDLHYAMTRCSMMTEPIAKLFVQSEASITAGPTKSFFLGGGGFQHDIITRN